MLKKTGFFLLFAVIGGCIDPYEFVIHNNDPTLVVEAFISDKSFNETLQYPSDGRYFTVKLTQTGDVINTRPKAVKGAVIQLMSSDNQVWPYTEGAAGVYSLLDDNFKAEKGVEYKLHIALADENVYESRWEKLPQSEVAPMGEISFTETSIQKYIMEASEWKLRTVKGVSVNIQVPGNNTGENVFYRWTYAPIWIYVAPLVSTNDPLYRCWATDPYYINTYGLQIDQVGGYQEELFFFPTIRNERIFEKFSVLIVQHALSESYYSFWKEMKDQNEGSSLIDNPPFNLETNFFSTSGDKKVSGYFGVSAEQAKRWYFKKSELSYEVVNTLLGDCLVVYGPGPPAAECSDCRAYSFGKATTTRPSWWQQ